MWLHLKACSLWIWSSGSWTCILFYHSIVFWNTITRYKSLNQYSLLSKWSHQHMWTVSRDITLLFSKRVFTVSPLDYKCLLPFLQYLEDKSHFRQCQIIKHDTNIFWQKINESCKWSCHAISSVAFRISPCIFSAFPPKGNWINMCRWFGEKSQVKVHVSHTCSMFMPCTTLVECDMCHEHKWTRVHSTLFTWSYVKGRSDLTLQFTLYIFVPQHVN